MRVTPVARYSPPHYPTRDDLDALPQLLQLAPERWRTNPAAMMALGAACLVLAGCRSDQPQQQSIIPPTPPSVQPKAEVKVPIEPPQSQAEEIRKKPEPTVEDRSKLKIIADPPDAPLEVWTGKRYSEDRHAALPGSDEITVRELNRRLTETGIARLAPGEPLFINGAGRWRAEHSSVWYWNGNAGASVVRLRLPKPPRAPVLMGVPAPPQSRPLVPNEAPRGPSKSPVSTRPTTGTVRLGAVDHDAVRASIGRVVADPSTASERRDRIHAILRDAMARLDDAPPPTQDQLEGQVRGYLAWLRGQGVI